jgi:hypothetical protein
MEETAPSGKLSKKLRFQLQRLSGDQMYATYVNLCGVHPVA